MQWRNPRLKMIKARQLMTKTSLFAQNLTAKHIRYFAISAFTYCLGNVRSSYPLTERANRLTWLRSVLT